MGAQDSITTALLAPNHNFGKDEYAVDLAGHGARYWQGTESGLLGAFEFKGASTSGDGSCGIGSRSMGAAFCNFNRLGWDPNSAVPTPSPGTTHTTI